MALFKILRGNAANLPKEMKDGYAYFCTDTHDFYIDYTNSNGQLTRGQLNAKNADHATNADNATKASKADKLTTGRTIGLKGAVTATATSFDGSSSIDIPINALKESYLIWGGKNFAANYGPLDAAMIDDLGANRLSFLRPGGITIEASKDNGATWSPYNATITNAQKSSLFTGGAGDNRGFVIGGEDNLTYTDKTNWRVRITINSINGSVYTELQKFAIYLSTSGSSGCKCSIYGKTKLSVTNGVDTWTTLATGVDVNGWSGWNIININKITFGNNANEHYNDLRFEFWVTSHPATSQYGGLSISRIMAFGGMGWGTPSNMAKNGHLYSYDGSQNATFPKDITSGGQLYSKGALKVDGTSTLTGAVTSGALTASSLKSNGALTVSGNSTLSGTLTTSGAATFNGTIAGKEDVNFQKKLTVGGDTTLAKLSATNITASGTLGVTGATTLSSLTTSGNTSVGGTLKATGATTLSSTLTVGSTTTLNAALNVNGASSLYGNLTVTGNTTLGDGTGDTVTTSGAFTAGGATSLNSTLGVKEKGTFEKDLLVKGNTNLGDNATSDITTLNSKLVANGIATFNKAATFNAAATLASLVVNGATQLLGEVDTNTLDVNGVLTVIRNANVGMDLGVAGDTALEGALTVGGTTTLNGSLGVKENTVLSKDLTVNKNATIGVALTAEEKENGTRQPDTFTVNGLSYLNGNTYVTGLLSANELNITGDSTIAGDLTVNETLRVNKGASFGSSSTDTTSITGGLNVSNGSTINGNVYLNTDGTGTESTNIRGSLNVVNESSFNGAVSIKDGLVVDYDISAQQVTASNYFYIPDFFDADFMDGEGSYVTIHQGDLTVNDGVTIGKDLYVGGTSYLDHIELDSSMLIGDEGSEYGFLAPQYIFFENGNFYSELSAEGLYVTNILNTNAEIVINYENGIALKDGTTDAAGIFPGGIVSATNYMEAPEFRGYLTGQAQSAAAIEWIYF